MQKLQSLRRKHSKFIFIEKQTMWIDFIKEDPCKKFIEKKQWSQLQNWGTQENKLSAMVTPWKKMLSGNPLQPVSLLKIPKTFFI